MTEDQFLYAVQSYVTLHPEVAPRLMEAARVALLERMRQDAQRATDMEVIAMAVLDRIPRRSLRAEDIALIRDKLAAQEGRTSFRWDATLARIEGGA